MAKISIAEFTNKLSEIMPVITREFIKHQTPELERLNVTMPQFVVMDIVHRNGESNMTDLAHSISVTTAAMTGIVDRLVKNKYVSRSSDAKDRRIIRIYLTEKGVKVFKKTLCLRKQIFTKIYGILSEREREEYINILMHIRDYLKE